MLSQPKAKPPLNGAFVPTPLKTRMKPLVPWYTNRQFNCYSTAQFVYLSNMTGVPLYLSNMIGASLEKFSNSKFAKKQQF